MHIALFGGTGRTGERVLLAALQQGWNVTALVRNPQKMTLTDARLRIITGELSNTQALRDTLAGVDAAIITLGTGTDLQATNALSEGTGHILSALEASQIRRVVCLLSGWLFYPVVPPPFVEITRDHARQLALLEASNLEWVAVCPPALVDKPAQSRYRLALNHLPGTGYQEIGVDDLAAFLLRAVVEAEFTRQKVGIAD
ncbi:MAG: SDR family oxidoreductase [Anaerolineae bacterium]|nr:SDR family oxidoreductase [Anaerolineae bacterium]